MESNQPQLSTRDILGALVKGRHPFSGEPLPQDCVLHHPSVIRALLEASEAVEKQGVREQRRSQLPSRLGKPWSEEEEAKLQEGLRAGRPLEELAGVHDRSVRAITLRLEALGETIPAAANATQDSGNRLFGRRRGVQAE